MKIQIKLAYSTGSHKIILMMRSGENDSKNPEYRTYVGQLTGAFKIYNAPTENLEQAVSLCQYAHSKQADLGKIELLGLCKASIIFSVMAIEAQVGRGIEVACTRQNVCPHCVARVRKLAKRNTPVKDLLKIAAIELVNVNLNLGAVPYQEWDKFLEYRNAALHSDLSRAKILQELSNVAGAVAASRLALRVILKIQDLFAADQQTAQWLHQIVAELDKLSPPAPAPP